MPLLWRWLVWLEVGPWRERAEEEHGLWMLWCYEIIILWYYSEVVAQYVKK